MELQGKKVLVTGGGTGIGRAVSLALAERGAIVAVNYSRSLDEAEETVQTIQSQGRNALAIQADVSCEQEVLAMVNTLGNEWGGIDLLVNNASVTRHIPMNDLDAVTDDAWDDLFQVNVKGMFYVARAVAPYMLKQEKGAIVNVGSIAGITGSGSSLPYAVSKAAVHGLTLSLARSLAPYVRVNCVAPGAVLTRWWEGREQQMEQLAGSLLLGETALPADIAHMICAVLEQEALTGQIITVDAGQSM
ncbi:SDR family NAD(P)-dependent oxidoreductase [Paenibacillus sp. D2_2]|uniref:SDR family NAD(P)-dependent oxidoreductase n=1 Tax=Paenibacillus sp. D2_2 TaxID=3073092 RepID=UPI0028149F58|nr:SDR family NAD(P)-dependent oxidoreductase [Paenibacillus sp. D2_2]WMT38986.1 SDR family NAD(P)-dependent oxidoreductase [Paenibacillus sp. D2_2]